MRVTTAILTAIMFTTLVSAKALAQSSAAPADEVPENTEAESEVPETITAQSPIALGTLTCTGGEGIGLLLGSTKSFRCAFTPVDGTAEQSYAATVTKYGLDIGITGKTVMIWTVLATTQTTAPGMLSGIYSGPSVDASIGIGGGAKVLIGGSAQSITLQPLSVQGQTGLNIAVGVASMELH